MNIGCRIIEDFIRADRDIIEGFRDIPVANIGDCMNRMAAVSHEIRPMNCAKLLGPAFTVKVPAGDNLMFHKAMDMAKEGDVIVIDAEGATDRAIFGELMINYCITRKLGGVIVDGCIRDFDSLKTIEFPVYAKGITPNGPYKNGPGEINTVISFGGQIVRPGDIVIGDEDGILIIKPEEADALLKLAKEVMEKEKEIMEAMEKDGSYIRPWVDNKLKELGCEYA